MQTQWNTAPRRFVRIGALVLTIAGVACGDTHSDEGKSSPSTAVTEEALQAQAAAQATVVATATVAPLVSVQTHAALGASVDLEATIEAAIAGLHAHLGECVTATPQIAQGHGTVAIEYKDCTCPFDALTFSGSGKADFSLDVSGKLTLALVNDLAIATTQGEVKATANMSAELGAANVMAGVDTTLTVSVEGGVSVTHTGKLDIKINGLCVEASLDANTPALSAHLQVSGMLFCANGPACVQGVELAGPEGKISLDVAGGVSISGQGQGAQSHAGLDLGAKFSLGFALGTAQSCTPPTDHGEPPPPSSNCPVLE